VFHEEQCTRTQEFALRWSPDGGQSYRQIVRQQYNFIPPDTTREVENYTVNLDRVTILELSIVPDISGGDVRAFDNIFVERLWRSVKYEEVYLKDYASVWDAKCSLRRYFDFYNNERPHQSRGYRTPSEVYFAGKEKPKRTNLTGGIQLMSSSVQLTNALLSQEVMQGDPAGQSQKIIHLNRQKILY